MDLLFDLDVAADRFGDEAGAALADGAGGVLADHSFFDFQAEIVVDLNVAVDGLGL